MPRASSISSISTISIASSSNTRASLPPSVMEGEAQCEVRLQTAVEALQAPEQRLHRWQQRLACSLAALPVTLAVSGPLDEAAGQWPEAFAVLLQACSHLLGAGVAAAATPTNLLLVLIWVGIGTSITQLVAAQDDRDGCVAGIQAIVRTGVMYYSWAPLPADAQFSKLPPSHDKPQDDSATA